MTFPGFPEEWPPCIQWWREAGATGGILHGRHFSGGSGISRKIKNWPVCGHLNTLQFSISVHQRCSVMFKMHRIHLQPGLRPRCRLGSYPHSLVGWDLGQGGMSGRTFAPGATDLRIATATVTFIIRLGQHVNTVAVINSSVSYRHCGN